MNDFVTQCKKADKLAQKREEREKELIKLKESLKEEAENDYSQFVGEACKSWEDMEKLFTDIRYTSILEGFRRIVFMLAFLGDRVRTLEKEKEKEK